MTIEHYFSSPHNAFFSPYERDNSIESNISQGFQEEIYQITLSKAVLEKQSDGALRWVKLNKFGSPEWHVFIDEEKLDLYLSQNEFVDIWEVEDRRAGYPKTIYKCCDPDDEQTFQSKDELYREIASTTEHGVFCIQDLDTHEARYVQQKRGWFQYGFEEILFEKAQKILLMRKVSGERQNKSFAIGIAALAAGPLFLTSGKILSGGRAEIRAFLPTYPSALTLQKTTTIFTATLLTYGMSRIDPRKTFSGALPLVVLGALSWPKNAGAQVCPQFAGSYDTPSSALGVVVSGNYAYVADYASGLQIIDVSNVTNPFRVGFYDTPGSAQRVALSGGYAYVTDWGSGLQIIDVSNVTNPFRVSVYDTPGRARGVALSGNYAYVADWGSGLQIIDVSNVTNPFRVSAYDTPSNAIDVALSGNYAYVADDTSGLQIIDVSNVTNLMGVGSYDTPDEAVSVVLSGNYAFVADWVGGGLQIIDVSNVTNPMGVGFYDTPAYAMDVALLGDYAYVADDISGLQIIDVSNVTNPVLVSFYDTPVIAVSVVLSGGYAFVADTSSGLQIIDLSCLSKSRTTSSSVMDTTVINNTFVPTSTHTISQYLPTNSASSNPGLKIGLGVGIIGVVCLGVTGITLFYLLKRRKESADLEISRKDESRSSSSRTHKSFELKPVKKKGHTEIGEEYYQLSTINKRESQEIYLQTGHLIVFPEDQNKFKYVIAHGRFGAIKIAQRKDNSQYVVSKKVKGEENIRASEAEANLQREAAGENILPIYNTIRLENALYHFMPLAGLGDGFTIQKQLSTLNNPKLVEELLEFVAKDLLTGLNTLHKKGIYHLDIKPHNLVFTKEGIGYLIGFGCAKKSGASLISSDALGDSRYFSPGRLQARREGTTFDGEKADLWAVGLTLLQVTKNCDPLQLFGVSDASAFYTQGSVPGFFQEKLRNIRELQYPKEGSIWWVINCLFYPHPSSQFTAKEALETACFKTLDMTAQARLFEDFQKERIALKTHVSKEEVDLSHYTSMDQIALKEEAFSSDESKRHQQYYDLGGYGPMPTAMTGMEHYQAPPEYLETSVYP